MGLVLGLREARYTVRFDIHYRNERLCFHRTRRLSMMEYESFNCEMITP